MKEKKAHGIQLLIRAVVRDPDGKVISDTGRKPAKSFVIQFLEFMRGLAQEDMWTATNVTGSEENIISYVLACSEHFDVDAGVGEARYGIVVGTGDTAVTNVDYKLETQLTQGITAGKISHGVQIVGTAAVAGANVDLEIKRAFTNLTGSAITVKEAGVYVGLYATEFHCIIRDVFPGPVNIPNGCSLTIYYTLRTTV